MKAVAAAGAGVLAILTTEALIIWSVMLMIGAIHSAIPAVPALSFWTTGLCLTLVSVVGYVLGIGRKR